MARHHEGSKEARMNRAAESPHKSGGDDRRNDSGASKSRGSDVGNERKADMKGAFGSNPGVEKNPLRHATSELREQHPHHHMDRGPHHHTTTHVRNKPFTETMGKKEY